MKILVTGSSGLVGSRFVELYESKKNLLTPSHYELDITNAPNLHTYISQNDPDIILNFSAYTNVSEAENQRDDETSPCWQVNVNGAKNISNAVEGKNIKVIQISTDMVFTGTKENPGPYSENQKPETDSSKLTWYGFTKAEAERVIGSKGAVLRLVYPVRSHFSQKLDYIRKPLQLFDQGKLYPMFDDQQISITFIDEACLAINRIIEQNAFGVFHAGSSDITTPFELFSYLFEKVKGAKNVVRRGSLIEFLKKADSPHRYPRFGGLKVEQTEKNLGIKYSTWKQIVDKLLEQGLSTN